VQIEINYFKLLDYKLKKTCPLHVSPIVWYILSLNVTVSIIAYKQTQRRIKIAMNRRVSQEMTGFGNAYIQKLSLYQWNVNIQDNNRRQKTHKENTVSICKYW
jgi:hypothetical protein